METVRNFRDRRYVYKGLTKKWFKAQQKLQKAEGGCDVDELQARPGPTAGLCGLGSRDSTRILDHAGMPSSPVYVSFAVATVLGSLVKWAC